ncbi:ankyrin repeat and LEM domain-containing protein 2 homolog isoform X2 [Musca domestica]|uniref:Ankyrin repeat and LEM domain-containing protein 2 homolog isoform X2 n=1 Tax=Musca domestica TaxID=7370 RepID=A0A9J7DLK4_MUSDO|nr:ankyrin repeat and LEM domain-containing protein 2 homolog isoform X2 [Musca domestica]
MPFYGLYIPVKGGGGATAAASGSGTTNASSNDNNETESQFVFSTKAEALKVLKKHKDARLKEFINEDEAMKYAQTGYEIVQQKYNDVRTSTTALETPAFRGPTKQELARFRKCIESDEYERVKQIIWDNPRYLVSSGDTPTSLKEGCRYNAMHICAISNRPKIAKLILSTVSDTKFVDLLTGKKNDQKMCQELCANLLDYYLNIPEKGRSETPLHFAAKYGFPEMVELLTSYPECKMTPNIEGNLPQHIICTRGIPAHDVYPKIKSLFEERFYVPVLRCSDASIPAQIGEPFSVNNPPNLNCDPLSPEVEIKALAGPMSKDQAKKFFRRWKTPPRLGSNVSSPIANSPFISPMKSRRSLPSTPAGGNSATNSPTAMLQRRSLFNSTPQRKDRTNGANDSNGFADHSIILDDSFEDHQNGNGGSDNDKENGQTSMNKIETNNNNGRLESKLKIGLCPGTPLFKIKRDAFFTYREQQQMASPMPACLDGQNDTVDYFNCSDIYDSPGFKERHVKNTDPDKGIECIGRNLAKEQNVEWREYWDFLDEFIDIASEKGIKKLESYLAQKQAEYEAEVNKKKRNNSEMLEEVCSALEKFGFGVNTGASDGHGRNGMNQNGFRNAGTTAVSSTNLNASTAHQSSTPYTYVEKSLQVHARRMTKTIVHNIDNVVSINDALLLELRRVKSLIYSFKEDASFVNVSFEKVHSRIGNLVATFLENSQEITIEMKAKILKILQNLLLTPGDRREHIECVCSRILHKLENPVEQILPENLKTEEMCSKVWSQENACDCQWESNLSRKTSHRNRMEARYKNHQRMKQQERAAKQTQMQGNDKNNRDYRNPKDDNDSSDDNNEDVFWSDFGSDSEEEEIFQTPPESPSRLSLMQDAEDDGYKIFIYGNEPTKRDLDVINAIFHVELDKNKYPTIHSWKSALMRYTNEEMDFFPSPRVVKKTHTFSIQNKTDTSIAPQTPPPPTSHLDNKTQSFMRLNINASLNMGSPRQPLQQQQQPTLQSGTQAIIREPILQLPTAKRLFASPGRPNKSGTATKLNVKETTTSTALTNSSATNTTTTINSPTSNANEDSQNKSTPEKNVAAAPRSLVSEFQRPLTPLNKIRGLFSAYRDRFESSPLPSPMTERNSKEGANSLSLLNISSTTDY